MTKPAYVAALKALDNLLPTLAKHIREVGRHIHTLLEIDREQGIHDVKQRGLPISTILRLERVGAGSLHEAVVLNGTVAANLAENLKFADQEILVNKGKRLPVGGTLEVPKLEVRKLRELTDGMARLLIDTKRKRFRTENEMKELYFARKHVKSLAAYTLLDGIVTFHRRKWLVDDLKALARTL